MNKEIEARFLNINKDEFIQKLQTLGAIDKGEATLSEIIFYDSQNKWQNEGRFVRIRSSQKGTTITYKQNQAQTIDSATEIEFSTQEPEQVEKFLEHIGLAAFRHQEKRRHTFLLNEVTIDIDTWPKIPTYVEFEGPSEKEIRAVAEMAGFDWTEAVFDDARKIIENRYNIPVGSFKWFTFDKFE
jgi:adenylate cyclase class 2